MVTCPKCNVSFNAADEWCPLCRSYAAPMIDRVHALANRAVARLEEGDSSQSVARMLAEADVPEAVADQLMAICRNKVARRERSAGLLRMLAGIGCLMLGVLMPLVGRFLLGVAFFVFGLVAIASGAWSFLTSRADAPASLEWTDELQLNQGRKS